MGNNHSNKSSHNENRNPDNSQSESLGDREPRNPSVSILKLFEKLELTADDGNTHPGELSRVTFENAFHGPLDKFGKLMYRQMKNGHVDKDRITQEEFVAAGTEIVTTSHVGDQRKYYFKLFAGGKEKQTREDACQMFRVSYMLTVSVSKIPHKHDERDIQLFQGMVTGLFGIEDQVGCDKLDRWLTTHCPNLFSGVHSWVCMVLGGSNLPSEMEANTARVPQLENFTCGQHSLCLGMAWALSAVLPPCYTAPPPSSSSSAHSTAIDPASSSSSSSSQNRVFSNYQSLMANLARLPKVQSWNLLYSSDRDGLSKNRFVHHVMSYQGPNLIFLCFEGGNQYCLALDTGLREGTQKFGGKDCCLVQLLPVYRVVQSGPNIALFNSLSRSIPKGIQIGQDKKPLVMRLDENFENIYHYDAPCALHRIEAWGCGGEEVRARQTKQKQWEAKDTERQRTRKLRLEGDWRETPDKQLLEWGGVKTGSSYLSGSNH